MSGRHSSSGESRIGPDANELQNRGQPGNGASCAANGVRPGPDERAFSRGFGHPGPHTSTFHPLRRSVESPLATP